jgi:5-methylcytosine-specific restriction protein B
MITSTLHEKAASYSLADDIVASRDKDRERFLERFPLEKLASMTIDEYVAGNGQDTFCYWLEFKKIGAGIGGGNATKFWIYRPSNTTDDSFAVGYGTKKVLLPRAKATEYFLELRTKLLKALDYAKNDRVELIKELEVPIWNMVLLKILTLYFPDKFITINAPQVLIKCARALHIEDIELKADNAILISHACKKALRNDPTYAEWANEKIGMFMWENFQEASNDKATDGPQYWLYAPGEKARLWEEFYEVGIMGMGWDRLGDFNELNSREDIKKALIEVQGGDGSKKNDIAAIDDFVRSMRIGDYIIVKKGVSELLGYGIVTSDVKHDDSRPEYHNYREVDWRAKGHWPVDFNLVIKTLTDITKYKSEHPDYTYYYQRLLGIMEDASAKNITPAPNLFSLNTIFYGPPGTGKTYHSVQRAAEIIEGRTIHSHNEALAIFKKNLHDRIEFITFHQNYSYEDFIQGLRPDTENNNQLTFERKDGIFKLIANRALKNLQASDKPQSYKRTFEEVFNEFFSPLVEGEIDEIELKMKRVSYFITGITNKSIDFRKASGGTAHTMSIDTLKRMYQAESVLDIAGLSIYYEPLLDSLLKLGRDNSIKATEVKRENYVIVIDEINRANISRVFGELITLIEPDKRSDGAIPLEVKLPSGDSFMIPSNLYIIGTMNTADKSIALLDIALRRRFEFEAMYPKYELDGKPLENADILRKINERIILTKGHDFQIGHAYFMGKNESLIQRMNNKVIPLLLEYYMNDEKEVKAILQSAGMQVEEKSWPLRITGAYA